MKRRIAITGATGFIGQNLSAFLADRGDYVRAVVRPGSSRTVATAATTVHARLDAGDLTKAFHDVDAVVHLAGVSEAARARVFHDVNVEGTRAVAAAAATTRAHLIHLSSLAATGTGTSNLPRTEDDEPAPVTPYGKSKLQSERAIDATGCPWTVLRPGPVYGPWDRAFLTLFAGAKRGMLPLTGRAGASYTFIYVADLVRTIAAAIDRGPGNDVIHTGHPRPISLLDLVEGIRSSVNPSARIIPVPLPVTRAASTFMHGVGAVTGRAQQINLWRYNELAAEGFVSTVDRMRRQLGVEARTDLPTGLALTADWYRREGWL